MQLIRNALLLKRMSLSVWIPSRGTRYQRFYIQVMTVHENNLRVFVRLERDTAVQIINVLGFLYMQSVVAQLIVFSGLTVILGDASQH